MIVFNFYPQTSLSFDYVLFISFHSCCPFFCTFTFNHFLLVFAVWLVFIQEIRSHVSFAIEARNENVFTVLLEHLMMRR